MTELNEVIIFKEEPLRIRRSRPELVRDVLSAAVQGSRKTHIMFRSNLNPVLLSKYLDFCFNNGLIVRQGAKYTTTPKGVKFIQFMQQIESLKKDISSAQSGIERLVSGKGFD